MAEQQFIDRFVKSITSKAFQDRLGQISSENADVQTLHLMLGRDLFLKWAHTLGVAQTEALRNLAPPIAPFKIRQITASHSESLFLWTGLVDLTNFLGHYHRVSEKKSGIRVLDYGCGGGRLTRFLSQSSAYETYGSDVNEDIVDWCASNLDGVTTRKNGALPPLAFDSASMDFIYAYSVFSHFPEENHKSWLAEMERVAAPGGIVLLTTHTEHAANIISNSPVHQKMFGMSSEDATSIRNRLSSESYIYLNFQKATLSITKAGDDYGHCFISEDYIKRVWPSHGFELIDYIPGGARGFQDIVLLRKR